MIEKINQQSSGRTGESESPSRKMTKIGRHGAEQLFTSNPEREERMLSRVGVPVGFSTPRTLEERVKLMKTLISQALGISVPDEVPNKIGFNISNDSQRRILLAVFQRLTDTNYKGDFQRPNGDILNKQYKNRSQPVEALRGGYEIKPTKTHIGGAYQNIELSPFVRFTRPELMREAGFDPNSGDDCRDFAKALGDLMLKQHFLMWTRYKRDKEGNVVLDKYGKTELELVSTFSTALNIEAISDPKTKTLLYYEISPSPVFLDEIAREYGAEREGYFILIPRDSYDEVKEAYNKRFPNRSKIVPDVIQTFCFWLRMKVVEIQTANINPFRKNKRPEALRISYLDICRILKYGDLTIRKNKKRIKKSLNEGFEVARDLGYLSDDVQEDLMTDEYIIPLNTEFFPNHFSLEEERDVPQQTTKREHKKRNLKKGKKTPKITINRFPNSHLFNSPEKQ